MTYGLCTITGCPDPSTCVDAVHHVFKANQPCQCGHMHNHAPHRASCDACGWKGPARRDLDESRRDYAFHEQIERIHRGTHLHPQALFEEAS